MKQTILTVCILALALQAAPFVPAVQYGEALKVLKNGDIQKAFDIFQATLAADKTILLSKNYSVSNLYLQNLEKETSLLNIAKAYFICGDLERSRQFLGQVVNLYPASSKDNWEATALLKQLTTVEKDLSSVKFERRENPAPPKFNTSQQTIQYNREIEVRSGRP
ncbi:MAG: hypothetical protein PHQ23_16300, partial [Candidatus Wallbacteria bacterium]|nr:hypothetical protein [Candidatus Wallbacteria bacterium]